MSVPDPLDEPLPFDAGVRKGVLDNGMTFLIEQNAEPAERAVFRLVLDAGSVLEDPDQLGIAHLLEHMAFNGSEHFESNDLIDTLQAMGMRFGAHVNAHTSFDETVYKLTVPTTESEQLDTAMLVFRDWAGGLTLSTEEIERERGVVIEEWRRRLGARQRLSEVSYPKVYLGSPYHERLPIGTLESLQTFDPEVVRRFYRDWYRPDLMAFIAVGDFDVDDMERRIRENFSDLTNPESPRERVRPRLPDHEPEYVVFDDPEITRTWVTVRLKTDHAEGTDHRSYRQGIVDGIAQEILNERLRALARQSDAPYLSARWRDRLLTPIEGVQRLSVNARQGEALRAYEALLVESARLQRHGITAAELERARSNGLRRYEAMLDGIADQDSSRAVGELIRSFTKGETVPGTEYEAKMGREYLPSITRAEVQAAAQTMLSRGSKVVELSQPRVDGVAAPTTADLQAVEARVAAMEIAPPEEEEALEPPVATPEPGSIVQTDTSMVDSLGFTRWTLSNGIDVYWQKTDLEDDEVLFIGRSPGGSYLVSDEDWVPMVTASSIATRSGAGALDVNGLVRWNAGKRFSMRVSLGRYEEQISGNASPGDLEHALALAYARVVAPRFDADAFDVEKDSRAEGLRNRLAKPSAVFGDAWNDVVWAADPRWKSWTVQTLEQMDLARSEALFRDRFADLHDMDFVIIGNLPDDFERVVTTWVATLPGGEREETWKDRGFAPNGGPDVVDVAVGQEPKAEVRLYWTRPAEAADAEERLLLDAAGRVLRERLREELREKSSGVYSVSARPSASRERFPHEMLTISFTCDPARVDELVARTLEVVGELTSAPADDKYIELVRAQNHRGREERVQTNAYWRDLLLTGFSTGEDPAENHARYLERVDALTAADVHAVLERLLTRDHVLGTRRPAE